MRAVLPLIAMLALACATPSRKLPPRPIDDPITVPRRTMEVDLGARGTASNEWRERDAGPILGFRYGVTDRIEWNGLAAFDYAIMDDAPVAHAATGARAQDAPFGLVAGGGIYGIGFSSIEGTIVQGGLGVAAVKHLGARFRVSAGGNWTAQYSEFSERSWAEVRVGGSVQLLERMTVGTSVWDSLESEEFVPLRDWREHTVGWSVGVTLRPAHWIDVGGGISVRAVARKAFRPPVFPPTEPIAVPQPVPRRGFPIFWASLWATLRW